MNWLDLPIMQRDATIYCLAYAPRSMAALLVLQFGPLVKTDRQMLCALSSQCSLPFTQNSIVTAD